ncbi:hypothetical protein VOLCADRAFT_100504 [Volvox carteri f. nagariensis]|uniref:Uncharacterized protein n=1 Tax=Volvox carteri f. nagariensis TaxID=3068 RepID=D8UKC6_VOLCA|nr:uncharacterized protein VOLCADRAFT_100504 [Volvox carteri f. nagariensis]EFJ39841.1 hypothetical protein VOLCADRAFT_100504 [Volvox carteri f. nagariensis]|eukprot:XP_002959113.1 hypothetical protein VOLCADRAFT_100504 [Volvox carteri f. nagariensis]
MAKPLRVPASALVTNQPFTTRSLTRKASIAESVLCPGLRGPELAALYGSDLQGVMQRSDVECATAHDRDIVDWLPELEEDKLEGFLDTAPPAYYGESDCIRSTLCAVVVQPGGGPCAACRELGVDKKHKQSDSDGGERGRLLKRPRDVSILLALRVFTRRFNACIARQPRDRIRGRFWGVDMREAVMLLNEGDEDHLSDGDYVAVLEEVEGRTVVRVALVEGLLCPQGRGRGAARSRLSTTRRLDIGNPDGRLLLRLLHPSQTA